MLNDLIASAQMLHNLHVFGTNQLLDLAPVALPVELSDHSLEGLVLLHHPLTEGEGILSCQQVLDKTLVHMLLLLWSQMDAMVD